MNEYQHLETIEKGDSVQYGNRLYRVQEDKGWLFIIVSELGRRKKIGVDKLAYFSYGSFQDWVFNEWWRDYPEYETFRHIAKVGI